MQIKMWSNSRYLTTILLVMLAIVFIGQGRKSSMFSESESEYEPGLDGTGNSMVTNSEEVDFEDDYEDLGDYQEDRFGLTFEPPELEFIGTFALLPAVLDFSIINRNPSPKADPITIFNIVIENSQFHTVTFQSQTLYYQDSINVHIMFLPYFVDKVETDLLIQTSVGEIRYRVSGHALANPYHLHPFIGFRIPAGEAIYEQPISIFNPHEEVLNIREIFTTESFLSLHPAKSQGNSAADLVDTKPGSPRQQQQQQQQQSKKSDSLSSNALSSWIVPPGVAKEVMLLSMSAKIPGSYNGYVHIVCDRAKFVIPVELIVLEGGLRLEPVVIDFGVLTELNEARFQDVFFVNSGASVVRILDIVTDIPDPKLQLDKYYEGVEFAPSPIPVKIATVTVRAVETGPVVNKLIVTTNAPNPVSALLSIPIAAQVLHGGIGFNQSEAVFIIPINNVTFYHLPLSAESDNGMNGATEDSANPADISCIPSMEQHPYLQQQAQPPAIKALIRPFPIMNYFPTPVLILKINLFGCSDLFMLEPINPKVFEKAGESFSTWPMLFIRFNRLLAVQKMAENVAFVPFTCYLEVHSNISVHRIPLTLIDIAIKIPFLDSELVEVTRLHQINNIRPFPLISNTTERGKECQPTFVANSDVYDVSFGSVSTTSPRSLMVTVQNKNPVIVGLYLEEASADVCICKGPSWASSLGGTLDEQASTALRHVSHTVPHTFETAKVSSDCSCRLGEPANSYGNNSSDPESNIQTMNTTNKSIVLELQPLQNCIFSFHFDSFKPSLDSQRYLYHVWKKMAFTFVSPVQRLVVNIHYHLLPGSVKINVVPRSLQWMIGLQNAIIVSGQSTLRRRPCVHEAREDMEQQPCDESDSLERTTAGWDELDVFDVGVQICSINTSTHPHRFQIFNTAPQVVSQGHSEHLSWVSELTPVEMCSTFALVGDLPTDSADAFVLINSGVRWNNLYSCLSQLLFGYNRAELQHVQQIAIDIVRSLYMQQFPRAHSQIVLLRKEWMALMNQISHPISQSPALLVNGGIPLSSFALQTKTKHSELSVDINNIVIHSPLTFIPETYNIRLPYLTTDQACLFFIEMYNPYAFPVGFSLVNAVQSSASAEAGSDSANGLLFISDEDAMLEEFWSLLLTTNHKLNRTTADADGVEPFFSMENYHSLIDRDDNFVSASWAMTAAPNVNSNRRHKHSTGAANTNKEASSTTGDARTSESRPHSPSRLPTSHQPKNGALGKSKSSTSRIEAAGVLADAGSITGAPSPFPSSVKGHILGNGAIDNGKGKGAVDSDRSPSDNNERSSESHRTVSVSNNLLEQSIASMLGTVDSQFKSVHQGMKRPDFSTVLGVDAKRIQLQRPAVKLLETIISRSIDHEFNRMAVNDDRAGQGWFIVPSWTLLKEYTAAPNSVAKIGPVLFVPPQAVASSSSQQTSTNHVTQPTAASPSLGASAPTLPSATSDVVVNTRNNIQSILFVKNNFTGVDRIELVGSTAAPLFRVEAVCAVRNAPVSQSANSCSNSEREVGINSSAENPIVVEDINTTVVVTWVNAGPVIGAIYDIKVGNRRCKDIVVNGGSVFAADGDEEVGDADVQVAIARRFNMPELCSLLPYRMLPNQRIALELPVLQTCDYSLEQIFVELTLTPQPNDRHEGKLAAMTASLAGSKSRSGKGGAVATIRIHAAMSPSRIAECIRGSPSKSPAGDALVLLCCITLSLFTFAQVFKLSKSRMQTRKISSVIAKGAKKRRNRAMFAVDPIAQLAGTFMFHTNPTTPLAAIALPATAAATVSNRKVSNKQQSQGLDMGLHPDLALSIDSSAASDNLVGQLFEGSLFPTGKLTRLLDAASAGAVGPGYVSTKAVHSANHQSAYLSQLTEHDKLLVCDAVSSLDVASAGTKRAVSFSGPESSSRNISPRISALNLRRQQQKHNHKSIPQSNYLSELDSNSSASHLPAPPQAQPQQQLQKREKKKNSALTQGISSKIANSAKGSSGVISYNPPNADAPVESTFAVDRSGSNASLSSHQTGDIPNVSEGSASLHDVPFVVLPPVSVQSVLSAEIEPDALNHKLPVVAEVNTLFNATLLSSVLAGNTDRVGESTHTECVQNSTLLGNDELVDQLPVIPNGIFSPHQNSLTSAEVAMTLALPPPPLTPMSPPPGFAHQSASTATSLRTSNYVPELSKTVNGISAELSMSASTSYQTLSGFENGHKQHAGAWLSSQSLFQPDAIMEDEDDVDELFSDILKSSLKGLLTPVDQPNTAKRPNKLFPFDLSSASSSSSLSFLSDSLGLPGAPNGTFNIMDTRAESPDGLVSSSSLMSSVYFEDDPESMVSPPPGMGVGSASIATHGFRQFQTTESVPFSRAAVQADAPEFSRIVFGTGKNSFPSSLVDDVMDDTLGFDIGSVADIVDNPNPTSAIRNG